VPRRVAASPTAQRRIERYRAAGATNPVVTGVLGTDYAATLRAAAAAPAGSTDG